MISWINYIVESSLVLALLLVFYQLVLSKEKCISYNRYYLLFTGVASIAIPTLNLSTFILQPKESIFEPIYELPAIISQVTTFAPQQYNGFDSFLNLLVFIYIAGVVWVSIKLAIKFMQLFKLIKASKKSLYSLSYKVILTHGKLPSFSFFNYLFLNELNKTKKELESIIAHEEAHISQKHSIDIILMEFYKVIFWFNPLSYQLAKAMRLNHEYLADYSVVKTTDERAYINTLLNSIYQQTISGIVHYFGLHSTEKRIQMIRKNINWNAIYKPYFSIPFISILFFTFSCHFEPEIVLPTTVGTEMAPKEFKSIINKLKASNPTRNYFFKLTNNIELEKIKALDYNQYTIDYEAPLKGYKKADYGIIYSFDNTRKLSNQIFSDQVYQIYEVSQIPTPWNGYEQLLSAIDEYANKIVSVKEDKTIWVNFVITTTGNIAFTNVSNEDYTQMNDKEAKEFGAVISAINATSNQWRVGKINNTIVNVEIELPIRLYKN